MVQTEEERKIKKIEYERKWRANNQVKTRLYAKKYRENHPDKIKAVGKKYRAENQDKIKAYIEANRDQIKKVKDKWSREHPINNKRTSRKFRTNHPGYTKSFYQKNKERIIAQQVQYKKEKFKTDEEYRRKFRLRQMSRQISGSLKGKSCINCNSTTELQRHHPSYDSYDFIILCRNCHQDLHNFLNGNKEYHKEDSTVCSGKELIEEKNE